MNRRAVAVSIVAVAAVAGIGVSLVASDDDPAPEVPGRDGPALTGAPLDGGESSASDPDAARLLALLDEGRDVEYFARYETRADSAQPNSTTVQVWRSANLVRRDTTTVGPSGTHDLSEVADGDLSTVCSRFDASDWTCEERDANQAPGVDGSIPTEDLAIADLDEAPDTIAGEPVRCFRTVNAGPAVEICTFESGVLARLAADDQVLEAVVLDLESVDSAVFTSPPPA